MIYKQRISVKRWKAYCKMVTGYGKMETKEVVNYGEPNYRTRLVEQFKDF
jgi:hypothetical protein